MKTPMQEAKEYVLEMLKGDDVSMSMGTYGLIELKLNELLEKEKEFALNLWGQYEKECIIYNDYLGDHAYSIDAIEWYDQTFNTKEK